MSWVGAAIGLIGIGVDYHQESKAQQKAYKLETKRINKAAEADEKRERERKKEERKTADEQRRDKRRGRASTILTQGSRGTRDYGLREQEPNSKTLMSK